MGGVYGLLKRVKMELETIS